MYLDTTEESGVACWFICILLYTCTMITFELEPPKFLLLIVYIREENRGKVSLRYSLTLVVL